MKQLISPILNEISITFSEAEDVFGRFASLFDPKNVTPCRYFDARIHISNPGRPWLAGFQSRRQDAASDLGEAASA
ncbi:hypothetical protein L3D22_03100 [Lysobacter soli]|uniref:hypothetical protein n=1 Tax=Lysobacter TaxID=68 RepID=UPI00178A2A5A|nr:hypothetical protein [Lysobacter soli]MDG2517755.1 hypothetical protein [Lysobacter soli]UTA54854.1 hypothetical protein L3D22_03100 [Lysobacter soli]